MGTQVFRRGRIFILAILGVLAGWAVMDVLAAEKPETAKNKTPPVQVKVAPVTEQSIIPELVAVGNVIPYQSVALTARLNSQISDIKFKAGDTVTKGQLLFVLDARELLAQLAQAKAKLAGDIALQDSLDKDYQRAELGVQQQFSSRAERDTAKAALEAQKAVVLSDQAAIQNLYVQIGYTKIVAPIDGRTGTINFTLGNTVRANDTVPLVTINQVKPVSIETALPQGQIDAVRAAQAQGVMAVTATTTTGRKIEGTLEYINNTIDPANGTFTARATFANEDEVLWPGTLVNLTIALGVGAQAIVVPEVAVQKSQMGDFVYVVTEGKAAKRDIKLTRIQDGLALVAEGLAAGEQVATDGIMSIKDGGPVSIDTGAPQP